MNRTVSPSRNLQRATRALTLIAAAAALTCASPAMAATIDFETFLPVALEDGELLSENGFDLLLLRSPIAELLDLHGGAGLIANNDDPTTCFLATCPSASTGNFLNVVNDSGVRISRSAGAAGSSYFSLSSLRLAFVAPAQVPDFQYGMLQLRGVRLDGTTFFTTASFPGQDAANNFTFGNAMLTPDFRSQVFTSLTINACLFNDAGECFNSLDNPAFGQAQFALDDISFAAVPEPASYLLMGLGISALALGRRRFVPSAAIAANTATTA